ncbi:hypothetical protein NEHOM01_0520 [Nematocida homosporus]|uniref:uncharacterized protein n=1 Tax=Nematocida homosporus TaxID=1912981 RepID=UPI00221EC6C3|nr:uncharacterized protein NEHOM01_0520 [Nematocida homosporus]KAI5184969.1 hypothetical protein NEHOM01_0520 [Nematocida homosporus]
MEYHVFKNPYVLIEDATGKHRPFYKEYEGTSKENCVPKVVLAPSIPRPAGKREKPNRRPGVCEMCVVRYQDYDQHILEKSHVKTLKEIGSYSEIDALISQLDACNARASKSAKKRLFRSS